MKDTAANTIRVRDERGLLKQAGFMFDEGTPNPARNPLLVFVTVGTALSIFMAVSPYMRGVGWGQLIVIASFIASWGIALWYGAKLLFRRRPKKSVILCADGSVLRTFRLGKAPKVLKLEVPQIAAFQPRATPNSAGGQYFHGNEERNWGFAAWEVNAVLNDGQKVIFARRLRWQDDADYISRQLNEALHAIRQNEQEALLQSA